MAFSRRNKMTRNRNAVKHLWAARLPLFQQHRWLQCETEAPWKWLEGHEDFAQVSEFLRTAREGDRLYMRESLRLIVEDRTGDRLCVEDYDGSEYYVVFLERFPAVLVDLNELD